MHEQKGFTLVELIMVIVLLGIVATISTQFVSFSVRGAIDVGDRQQRALQAVVISEQITRELREAFPISVRKSGQCLEWLPILGGTRYESLPFEEEESSFIITPFPSDVRKAIGNNSEARLVVYGYGNKEALYEASNGASPISPTIQTISDSGEVTLTASHRFTERSPQKRIYAVGEPIQLCPEKRGNWTYLYRISGDGRGLMSANLKHDTLDWHVTPASLQRSAVVNFEFELGTLGSDETTYVNQEVQIRNVP